MFPAVVSRLDSSTFSTPPTSHSLARRVQVKGYSAKEIKRHGSRFLFTTVQRRRKFSYAVQSDVTENAQYETTLLPSEEPGPSSETTMEGKEKGKTSKEEPASEADLSPADVILRNSSSASEGKLKGSTEDSERIKLRDEVVVNIQPSRLSFGTYVKIEDHESSEAFLPYRLYPNYLLPSKLEPTTSQFIEERFGSTLRRKAMVIQEMKNVDKQDKSRYVVSCKDFDEKILYKRFMQVRDLCKTGETLRGIITLRNKGGLLVRLGGVTCFLPRGFLLKKDQEMMSMDEKEFNDRFRGSEIVVCVKEVQSSRTRIVLSSVLAQTMQRLEDLRIGSLVRGTVIRILPYGVFVQIDGLRKRALLHVRNISQKLVKSPSSLFTEGDRVCAIVMDMDASRQRIALSTADLEEERGEMMYNKERVMQNAPIMAARLKREIDRAREQYNSEAVDPPFYEEDC